MGGEKTHFDPIIKINRELSSKKLKRDKIAFPCEDFVLIFFLLAPSSWDKVHRWEKANVGSETNTR